MIAYRVLDQNKDKVYSSIDEVIERYLKPMNNLVQDVISNKKFSPSTFSLKISVSRSNRIESENIGNKITVVYSVRIWIYSLIPTILCAGLSLQIEETI